MADVIERAKAALDEGCQPASCFLRLHRSLVSELITELDGEREHTVELLAALDQQVKRESSLP